MSRSREERRRKIRIGSNQRIGESRMKRGD